MKRIVKDTEAVLYVRDLSKNYGSLKAVHELDFDVQRGEIFGILGPNGSGKTSTIESILGTRRRNSGTVKLCGLDPLVHRQRVFKNVGVQFQESAWQSGIQVAELCEFTASLYSPMPDWSEELERFDLLKRKRTAVERLSGGERQKLAILLACFHKPQLVFLDELTTGLDPLARRETWRFIKQLQGAGTTVVLSSHYMDEVKELCNRVIILSRGQIASTGSIAEVLRQGQSTNLETAYINIVGGAA